MMRAFCAWVALVCITSVSGLVSAQHPAEILYRFDDPGDGFSIVDSVSGNTHGQLDGGAVFNTSVAPVLESGTPNTSCAEFTSGFASMNVPSTPDGHTFVLHTAASGGTDGDASVEWLTLVYGNQGHNAMIWSNWDGNQDTNRFNIFYNAAFIGLPGPEDDNAWGAGFRDPSGAAVETSPNFGGDNPNVSANPLQTDTWNQLAIVRTDLGGSYEYTYYMNGVLLNSHTRTVPSLNHPDATSWGIMGRQLGEGVRGLVDEMRLVTRAIAPGEMNTVVPEVCPMSGEPNFEDTECNDLSVNPPSGSEAGEFTLTADASDATGDIIFYDFTVTNGVEVLTERTISPTANFFLTEGSWTASVVVDDSVVCDDDSASNFCDLAITVTAPKPFTGTVHLRFEEGVGTDIIDTETGQVFGSLQGAATFSTDTAEIEGGPPNNFSLDFTGGWGLVEKPFPLHANGAPGDVTLEWLMKVAESGHPHGSIFWTNSDVAGDANRFNIFWNNGNHGGADNNTGGDYKCPSCGGTVNIHSGGGLPVPLGAWIPLALIRTEPQPGMFSFEWFVNGESTNTATTADPLPDALSWEICGRTSSPSLAVLMDEIKASDSALLPSELQAVSGCPGAGDTSCQGLTLDPAPNDPAPPQGVFLATASAMDVSGDDVLYTFTATDAFLETQTVGPQTSNSAFFFLPEGAWTIRVDVDDDLICGDSLINDFCEVDIDVGPPVAFSGSSLYRFEDAPEDALTDEVSGGIGGRLEFGASISTEVPTLASGATNLGCGDFRAGGFARFFTPFAFHDAPSGDGGAAGLPAGGSDASVELLLRPAVQGHSSVFWTNGDDNADDERFNIFFNLSGPDRKFSGDYRTTVGGVPAPSPIGDLNGTSLLPIAQWSQVAINRIALDETSYQWDWYVNGELNSSQTVITDNVMPTTPTWLLAGRQNSASLGFRGLVDELRLESRVLDPGEMNLVTVECPMSGDDEFDDTVCLGIAISPQQGPPDPPAGAFTFTVGFTDATGDLLTFEYSVDNGIHPPEILVTPQSTATFLLTEGTWTVTVSVDDNSLCDDDSSLATCSETFNVGPPVDFPDEAWYRFEDGDNGIVEHVSAQTVGALVPSAAISIGDTPNDTISLTGDANTGVLDTTGGGFGRVTDAGFVFNSPFAGGAVGDATLELFIKVPTQTEHSSWLWTNGDNGVDGNRFNFFYNVNFLETPDSERRIGGDVVTTASEFVGQEVNERPLDIGEWHHVAVVRTVVAGGGAGGLGGPAFDWTWYIDGEESVTHASTTTTEMPIRSSWLISGRQNAPSFRGLLDEIRMSNSALTPAEFLTGQGDSSDDFRRGDHDGSGVADITDALNLLGFLFLGTTPPICGNASDFDNSGALDITDALILLGHLFLGQPNSLPAPGTSCGPNPTTVQPPIPPIPEQQPSDLGCDQYPGDAFPGAGCP